MSYTQQNQPTNLYGQQPVVVVKVRQGAPLVAAVSPPPQGGDSRRNAEALMERVRQRYPGATMERGINGENLARLEHEAGGAARQAMADLDRFYRIKLPAGTAAAEVASFAQSNRELVELAYVDIGVMPARIDPTNDPKFPNQTYLRGRRGDKRGIYANFAWAKGSEGAGIGVVFTEFAWQLNHEDLAGAGITLISGINGSNGGNREHGTCCVGEVMGQDNDKGIVGIAPKAKCRVVSVERTAGNFNTADAIIAGVLAMARGDVMSISLQTAGPIAAGGLRPLEIRDLEFTAIWIGSLLGRIICTAAGNGGIDLDTITNSAGKFVLRRGHADFKDSGAIVVGAATDTRPHDRMSFSNFGSRVDCFAQGTKVTTTSTASVKYTDSFNGTSAATPIVAGAAVLTQGLAKAKRGSVLSLGEMRGALAGTKTSIRSRNPATDRIGRMPNLQLISQHLIETMKAPTAARGHELAVEPLLYIDPGHGGDADAGRSSAYGGSGALGVYEKDIALDLARRVQAYYGGPSRLSRDGDYNLSLQRRVEDARRAQARAFVSVHANSGVTQNAGPEVWVYGNGFAAPDAHSASLAEHIRDEIADVYGRAVPIREGRLAVLDPGRHRRTVPACLVEAGSLADPADERRLTDASSVDAIGSAVARGVQRYMGTVALESDEAIDQEDTQYETMARASMAEDDEYASIDPAIRDVAQSYADVASGNGDHDDDSDAYS